jgi:hypothetical protein
MFVTIGQVKSGCCLHNIGAAGESAAAIDHSISVKIKSFVLFVSFPACLARPFTQWSHFPRDLVK